MGFWSLGNSAMKDVPRDLKSPGMQAMAKGMVNRGTAPPVATDGNTAGSNGTNLAPSSNAQPAAASASKSKYSDL
jgi:hypothetical protein